MIILSHRGYWKSADEKNTEVAFERSFTLGFGTETDVRDFNGGLVISHDVPNGREISFEKFLRIADRFSRGGRLVLALNVKADGLSERVSGEIRKYCNLDCFLFDMSVPDMRDHLRRDIPVFTRMSEVENPPVWLDRCSGVWLDSFETEWFSNSIILELLTLNKRICIVSPELHGRDHMDFWQRIKPLANEPMLMLCTDYPEQAREFFRIN